MQWLRWFRPRWWAMVLSAVTCEAGIAALLFAPVPDLVWGRFWYVVLASTAFVVMGVASGALCSIYGRWMLLGLVGCWFGDTLGYQFEFVWGALAFLVGHLFFIAAYWSIGPRPKRVLLGLAVTSVPSLGAVWWLWPHLDGGDFALVMSYLAVITLMVAFAAGVAHVPGGWLIFAGAFMFYISDFFVARWQYIGGGRENSLFCYPLYYNACLLLAYTCAARIRTSRDVTDIERQEVLNRYR